MTITLQSSNKVFGGEVRKYTHASASTGTDMTFSVYVPPAAALHAVPVVYYLSGLTCTDDNAVQKGGAFRACADQGIMMVFPDTSPAAPTSPERTTPTTWAPAPVSTSTPPPSRGPPTTKCTATSPRNSPRACRGQPPRHLPQVHHRTLHGRPWRPHHRLQEPGRLRLRLRVAPSAIHRGALGREGLRGVPRLDGRG